MTIDDAVSEFLIYSENVQCLSPNSIVSYRNDLKNFTAFCGGGQVDMASITLWAFCKRNTLCI
ncbi:MAG: hypothetical protein K6F69_00015, partial [Treponema sp.]|nr:hypothetical protein [Treponema sp.]